MKYILEQQKHGTTNNVPDSLMAKDRRSDAGGLGSESQTRQVTGKSIPSLWRDKHPGIKGLRPPEHHAGHSILIKRLLRV